MHDGGVNHIEVQPIAPITNPVEMDEDLGNIVKKLQNDNRYREMFRASFGSDSISSKGLLKALAQFMGLMYSTNSKYDQVKQGVENVRFTDAERRGYSLFIANCATCHDEPLFSDFEYRNNGLSIDPVLHDSGRAVITLDPTDLYRFKTPSLRNIAVTAPYMHDGRFATLEECLDHYGNGIRNEINLAPELKEYGIPLAPDEKKDLIIFLNTLTDFEFLRDRRFSDPNFK